MSEMIESKGDSKSSYGKLVIRQMLMGINVNTNNTVANATRTNPSGPVTSSLLQTPLNPSYYFLNNTETLNRSSLLHRQMISELFGGDNGSIHLANQISRISRQKVRIHRNRLLESTLKVMSSYGSNGKHLLEVEFFDEVGSGLGPTLEFYSIVCKELQKTNLGLWWSSDESNEYVMHPVGLFPLPFPKFKTRDVSKSQLMILTYFKMMGTLVARAFLDNRLLGIYYRNIRFKFASFIFRPCD